MSTDQPDEPWGGSPPPGGGYPPPPPPGSYQPPPPPNVGNPGTPPPGGGYPPPPPPGGGYPPPPPPGYGYPPAGSAYPGGGYPGGGYPSGGYQAGGYGGGSGKGMTPFGPATGWWQRVGATIVDGLVLIIPNLIVALVIGASIGSRLVSVIIQVAYTTVMLSQRGQTVGNMAVGTRVVDSRTGAVPSTGKALGRSVAPVLLLVLLVIPAIVDIFWPLWDRENQSLHDKMAGTYVIRT